MAKDTNRVIYFRYLWFLLMLVTDLSYSSIVFSQTESNFDEEMIEEDDKQSIDTPVTLEEIQGDIFLTQPRKWRAPDFSNQSEAIGYDAGTFDVPKGMEKPYFFWIDIYSKYNTDQGLIHDSEHMDLIYEVVDFSEISSRTDLNPIKKEIYKKRVVRDAKKRVISLLTRLEKLTKPDFLNSDERKIWEYFQNNITGKNKWKEARKENRVRFQLGQRDRVIQGIYFSGRYLEEFEQIFKEYGVPIELTRLAFVESSFNVMARSKVGASGLWQLMSYTAKAYARSNEAVDKRNYPREATHIAAKLLRSNYKALGSWAFAATGWNHGPSGLQKLLKLHQTRELYDVCYPKGKIKKRLGFASRNFYMSFLAVLEVERKAPFYLGNVTWSKPLDAFEVRIPRNMFYKQLLSFFDNDDHRVQIFNPHLEPPVRKNRIPIPAGTWISIPDERKEGFQESVKEEEKRDLGKKRKSKVKSTKEIKKK